jgi:hypothetical protein
MDVNDCAVPSITCILSHLNVNRLYKLVLLLLVPLLNSPKFWPLSFIVIYDHFLPLSIFLSGYN